LEDNPWFETRLAAECDHPHRQRCGSVGSVSGMLGQDDSYPGDPQQPEEVHGGAVWCENCHAHWDAKNRRWVDWRWLPFKVNQDAIEKWREAREEARRRNRLRSLSSPRQEL
jgi:hypothetical protein